MSRPRGSDAPGAVGRSDPTRWSRGQARALGGAVGRELGWGLRLVGRRVAVWRRLARQIPDPVVREEALLALSSKRSYADGAALFWILPRRRDRQLLRLLVDFQVLANYLDQASEQGATVRGTSGEALMRAFTDAVDLGVDVAGRDYYRDHPWADDHGYLAALVSACRDGCARLPRYPQVRTLLAREAALASSLGIGHDPQAERRDTALRALVGESHGPDTEVTWWELASGAASAMTVIALLAVAAAERTTPEDDAATVAAYRWVGALSTMLDSYVDQAEDLRRGSWSAIGYYESPTAAAARLAYLIERSLHEVAELRRGHEHVVIVAAMVALFLSRDDVREQLPGAPALVDAGGALTQRLIGPLRLWRVAHGQQAV